MRFFGLVGTMLLCSCTGRALRVDAPDGAVVRDLAVTDLPAPYVWASDLASVDLSLLPVCSRVCGQWDYCLPMGGVDYACNVECDAQMSGYTCLLGCDPSSDCETFLACVATCDV